MQCEGLSLIRPLDVDGLELEVFVVKVLAVLFAVEGRSVGVDVAGRMALWDGRAGYL